MERYTNQQTVHVIGDSHSCFFYGSDFCNIHQPNGRMANPASIIPWIKVYHIGPALAFNLCKLNTKVGGRERIIDLLDNVIVAGSRVLLCFGEIDCRYHIFKAALKRGVHVYKAMDECLERYVAFSREIEAMGYDVTVWGVVASLPDSAARDPEYPRFGTCVDRNVLTRQFNQTLQAMLDGESISFASVFEKLVDEENETKTEFYLDDKKHLSQKIMTTAIEVITQSHNYDRIISEELKG